MGKLKYLAGALLFLVGIGICSYPDIRTTCLEKEMETSIERFQDVYGCTEGTTNKSNAPLYLESLDYNRKIYEDGQAGFADPWGYEQPQVSLDSLEGDIFGYIEIPSMDAVLPLYLGSSEEHLLKGATIMGQTSLPLGEKNSNSVIAGHRGYYGSPYFRDIEQISIGDMVYVTNPWERLAYRAVAIDIISASDLDAVRIQEGKDMVTLVTCHPYAPNTVAKKRYIVYCERYTDGETGQDIQKKQDGEAAMIAASDGQVYESSGQKIRIEEWLRRGAAVLLLCMGAAIVFSSIPRKGRRKKE